ncbi:helix-turn-helix domain-containing protein [Segetibacter sp.]|jgi:AraC-like DNA-binding protein|uniref:helix-turn-helix domain-containing protein n=1 Tax=Segetibacter sp. TaxID=2231182 RepID=UPI0026365AF0|nr:helix-turn-helix domain-containing protein [Segetibacter sp.]MCW3078674.1 Helix-turn-helix, AraC protein [Segetibacter sp.]
MLLQDFLPISALRSYVRCFRIIHFCFDPTQPVPYKAYPPKPEQTLHFFLKKPFLIETKNKDKLQPDSILFTAQQTSLVNHFTEHDFIDVQIVFQPTAVFQLTGIPATELINQFLEGTIIFPKTVQSTFSQLHEAMDYTEIIPILEAFALRLIHKSKREKILLDAVCGQMEHYYGNVSMDGLAKQACYSIKQFKRKFAERVGLNPKTYARILRLNRAYNIRNCFAGKSWNAIALQCGYTDYQHLAKDYKEFNGLTPAELHSLEKTSPESVLGLSKSIYRNRFTAPFVNP